MALKKTDLPPVLNLAEITAMKQPERVSLFALKDLAAGRIFIELGKLLSGIESGLSKNQTLFGVLLKAGVRKGSISNASQTARVLKELVVPGHLAEAKFDRFTWSDICAINRVMSGASKRKLTAEEVVVVVEQQAEIFDAEFESLFATGMTVAEAEAKATADAAILAQAAKEKQEQEKQTAQNTPPPQPIADPVTAAAPTQAPQPPEAGTPTPEPAPAAADPVENAAPGTPAEPANVVPMPPDPDANVPDALAALDLVLVAFHEATLDGKKAIFGKLLEVQELMADSMAVPAAA